MDSIAIPLNVALTLAGLGFGVLGWAIKGAAGQFLELAKVVQDIATRLAVLEAAEARRSQLEQNRQP